MKLAGKFIVIDGPDGAGKSTQLERLKHWIEAAGGQWTFAKDPGGTLIGDRIRHVLLDYDLAQMDARCETLLFMASRAQLVAEVIRPALAAGRTVVGDRYISATCAYQVAAGMPLHEVLALGKLAVGDTWPDLTLILDVPAELGFERTGRSPRQTGKVAESGQISMFADATTDAMERRPLAFHRRVRQIFTELPGKYPRPVVLIDATRDVDAVFADIEQALRHAFS